MSLLKTAARAHVTARVVGSTHRRQQQRWAAQDAAAAQQHQVAAQLSAQQQAAQMAAQQQMPPASPAAGPSMVEQLTQLGQLRDAGVLTEQEFQAQKQRILAAG